MEPNPPLPDDALNQPEKPPIPTLIALALASALAVFAVTLPDAFIAFTKGANKIFMDAGAEGVVVAGSLLMLLCIGLAASPLGKIRLGLENEKPEFSTLSWLSMLFAAGMGSGLLYWGVAEPMFHLQTPPPATGDLAAIGDARLSMVVSYLHWALHPWGIYASGALCIAYFSFCKGFSMLPSSPFRAVLPKNSPVITAVADVVDVACVIALLLGLAAAISIGVTQIASGTQWLGNPIQSSMWNHSLVMGALVLVYMLSAATSLNKGIKWLSQINMTVAAMMIAAVCLLGPLAAIWNALWQGIGDYLRFLPEISFIPLETTENPNWIDVWTANYFLSWIAWVPFVGIFVARISRGRTIREFVLGVVVVPSIFSFIWFAILGGTAIDMQQSGQLDLLAALKDDSSQMIFTVLSQFPASMLFYATVVFLVFIFLVTSADSASYVLAMLAGQGKAHPSRNAKLFWGAALAMLTTGTLFSESGVHSVRALFSFAGIAVFFILLGQIACLLWGLGGHSRSKRDKIEY